MASDLGMRPLAAHCHLGLSQLHRRIGDRAKGDEHLEAAIAMYREMGMDFWLAQAEVALGAGEPGVRLPTLISRTRCLVLVDRLRAAC